MPADSAYYDPARTIDHHEVMRVLSGLSCDGQQMRTKPSYPSDPESIVALADDVQAISAAAIRINARCLAEPTQRTSLIRKLASYLIAATGAKGRLAQPVIAALAAGIAEDPGWHRRSGIQGLLRRGSANSRRTFDVGQPVPEPLLHTQGALVLYELTHPQHLVDESNRTGNCVGTAVDYQAARRHLMSTTDLRYLTYWRRIVRGTSRLFSVRSTSGRPLATVEYRRSGRHISRIEFGGQIQHGHCAIISFIVRAFGASKIPVHSVHVPTCLRRKAALAANGDWVKFRLPVAETIVGGWIDVPALCPLSLVNRFIRMRGIHLEFHGDAARLMQHLAGPLNCASIFSTSTQWPAGVTEVNCAAHVEGLATTEFTSLKSIRGALFMCDLVEGHFPLLTQITGLLEAVQLERYTFPVLRAVDGVLHLPDYLKEGLPLFNCAQLKQEQALRDFDIAWDDGH